VCGAGLEGAGCGLDPVGDGARGGVAAVEEVVVVPPAEVPAEEESGGDPEGEDEEERAPVEGAGCAGGLVHVAVPWRVALGTEKK
jgi:hypothetical protein